MVRRFWPNIKQHLSHLATAAKGDPSAWPPTLYGDWLPPSFPPGKFAGCNPTNHGGQSCHVPLARPYTSAFAWVSNLQASAEMADVIGEESDAAAMRVLIAELARRWNDDWLHQNGTYDTGIQTTFTLPLALGDIVPNASVPAVTNAFIESVQAAGLHSTTGDVGAKAFFPALAAVGRKDIALAVLEKTDYPSFGFMKFNTLEPAARPNPLALRGAHS